jgi:hypothetical protein
MGYNASIDKMVKELSEIEYIINYYLKKNKVITRSACSLMEGIYKEYFDKYNLFKYIKF